MYIFKYLNGDRLVKMNRYIDKYGKSKIKLLRILSKHIKYKINDMYRFKNIIVDTKIYNDFLSNNPQFQRISSNEYRIATRNILFNDYIEDKVRKNLERDKKHKIIKRSIESCSFRNLIFISSSILNIKLINWLSEYTNTTCDISYKIIKSGIFTYWGITLFAHITDDMLKSTKSNNDVILNAMEDIYQEIINRFCLLAYSLDLNTPVQVMALYNLMCNNTLLSCKQLERENAISPLECVLLENPGYKIILGGNAVCRHHSVFYRDICLRLGYDAKVLSGNIVNKDNENVESHAIVGLEYEDKYMYLDIVNETILNYDSKMNLTSNVYNDAYLKQSNYNLLEYTLMKLRGYDKLHHKKNILSYDEWYDEYTKTLNKLRVDENVYRLLMFKISNNELFEEFNELSELLDLSEEKVKKKY